ncbi:MAG: TonB family protein, partial [Candidatus Binatus sp.]|nr:TonB family protein [Candidatus Binatus sp.]
LASTMNVQVTGDSSSAPERSPDAARKLFEDHKNELFDPYARALSGDSTFKDAMVLRLHVLPNGSVDSASVRTSTNPNPSLDAEVVKAASGWTFPPISGAPVDVDYPVIFTNDPSGRSALESQLSSKLAAMSPTEAPEYASAPAAPGPASPGAAETPPAAAEATPVPPLAPEPKPRPRRTIARPAATPTLQQRVKQVLASNPKLRRVDCYTSGSTVTIFGKVFDAATKDLAERVVRGVPGVGNVVDSLSTDEGDWAMRQNRIAAQLANAGLTNVTVKVIGHDAYLGGTVKTDLDKQRAVNIAESAAPVQVRTNLITVEPGRVFGF